MMRFVLSLGAATLLGACEAAPEAAAPANETATLRIAAWNIEHLTAETGAGCAPRDEAGLDRVADYIRQVDADIWLLQEIACNRTGPRPWALRWKVFVDRQ